MISKIWTWVTLHVPGMLELDKACKKYVLNRIKNNYKNRGNG